MQSTICHIAIPSHDLEACKQFYVDGLGCELDRESEHTLVLNFGNNQLVVHQTDDVEPYPEKISPRHFGLIFDSKADWDNCINRAKQHNLKFFREPMVRSPGKATEHDTFFLIDPSNNLLEFKLYHDADAIFGAKQVKQVAEE